MITFETDTKTTTCMKQNMVVEAAEQLRSAALSKTPCLPIRTLIGSENIALAYAIQEQNIQALQNNGAFIKGYKIGLTSKAVQKQLGVDQPDFGVLLNTMEITSNSINYSALMQPKAEAEIALVLKNDIHQAPNTIQELLPHIDYALSAIEIVGSRIENWDIHITDTIADNASASHYILGKKKVALDQLDIVNCSMELIKNNTLVSEGTGSACLGNPLNAALWLTQTMMRNRVVLKKGEVLLTGALGPMTSLEKGDVINANITGFDTITLTIA